MIEGRSSFEESQQLDYRYINPINTCYQESSNNNDIPIKKLSDAFEDCLSSLNTGNHMKVYLRVRPTSTKDDNTVTITSDTTIFTSAPDTSKRALYTKKEERHYVFDRIFGPDSLQSDVFDVVAYPLYQRFIRGENVVLFAYGMTNAGKTFTIQGAGEYEGILPRLIQKILEQVKKESNMSMSLSMLEIYQEKIYDLLSTRREKLLIRDGNGKVEVAKLSSHPIQNTIESMKLLNTASDRRAKSETVLNAGSSRSHAVYCLTLKKVEGDKEITSTFQIVDLAGAERGNRTKATVSQQKEANNINMSLMQLWRCLQSMKRKSDSSTEMIPFRESKLTHLLMPVLCTAGLAGISLIACINPQMDDYDETISILANASLANKIKEVADIGRTMNTGNNNSVVPQVTVTNTRGSMETTVTISTVTDDKTKSSVGGPLAVDNKKRKFEVNNTNKTKSSILVGNFGRSKKQAVTNVNLDQTSQVAGNSGHVISDDMITIIQENKRLRTELQTLVEENERLKHLQIAREHEIRVEVSQEMSQKVSQLLDQIVDLQYQVNASKESNKMNITKSVRKIRLQQIEENQEEEGAHLVEAENEISRLKSSYEREIDVLKSEKLSLEIELRKYTESKQNQESSSAITSAVTVSETSFSPLSDTIIVQDENRKTHFADELHKRMQRDAKFKKSDTDTTVTDINDSSTRTRTSGSSKKSKNTVDKSSTVDMILTKFDQENNTVIIPCKTNSPKRSPLSPLRNDNHNNNTMNNTTNNTITNNSPIRLDLLNHVKPFPSKSLASNNSYHLQGNNENIPVSYTMQGGIDKDIVIPRRALRSRVRSVI